MSKMVEYEVCEDIMLRHYASYQQFEDEGAMESDGYRVSLVPFLDAAINGDAYQYHSLVLSNWFCEVEVSGAKVLGNVEFDQFAQATQLATVLNAVCRYFNEGGDVPLLFEKMAEMVKHFNWRNAIPSAFPNPVFVCSEFTVFSSLFHLFCVRRAYIRGKPKVLKSPYTTFSDSPKCIEKLIKQWGVPLDQREAFTTAMQKFYDVYQATLVNNPLLTQQTKQLKALIAKSKAKENADARRNKRTSASNKRKSNPRTKRTAPETPETVSRKKNR